MPGQVIWRIDLRHLAGWPTSDLDPMTTEAVRVRIRSLLASGHPDRGIERGEHFVAIDRLPPQERSHDLIERVPVRLKERSGTRVGVVGRRTLRRSRVA
jgi:hypothetical protein